MEDFAYRYFDKVNEDFVALTAELDGEFADKNGPAQEKYNQFNKLNGIKDIVIVYHGTSPVACAAIKKFDDERYEVKRVYVKKEYRSKGLARGMMLRLEKIAADYGSKSLILETSKTFSEAINLYRKLSYGIIENYGQYAGMSLSVCMEKSLGTESR
jgi:Acetyltransferases